MKFSKSAIKKPITKKKKVVKISLVLPELPSEFKLTAVEQSALRARAHSLNPVVSIGTAGVTDSVLLEIERSLRAHGLIKIKIPVWERTIRQTEAEAICIRLGCAFIQLLGRTLTVYRPKA